MRLAPLAGSVVNGSVESFTNKYDQIDQRPYLEEGVFP